MYLPPIAPPLLIHPIPSPGKRRGGAAAAEHDQPGRHLWADRAAADGGDLPDAAESLPCADELGELDGHGRAHARGGAGVRAADGLQVVGLDSGACWDWIWLCSVSYASVRTVHAYGYDIVLRIHIASLRSLMVAIKTRNTRFGTSGTVSGRA